MNLGVSKHELRFPRDHIKGLQDQSPNADARLQQAARILAWLAALILVLALAGTVYQAMAGVPILILALASDVCRFLGTRRKMSSRSVQAPLESCLIGPDLENMRITECHQVT